MYDLLYLKDFECYINPHKINSISIRKHHPSDQISSVYYIIIDLDSEAICSEDYKTKEEANDELKKLIDYLNNGYDSDYIKVMKEYGFII